ncbi:MAG: DUF3037 domain-containing protein [Muribaculaceae bacterium]|nr:DUF3037 domain-containing protein [Muribaculaceae bacterium]
MQELNKYEYAVVRYVPRVEREEFINVGLAMMCKRRRWIRVQILLSEEKIRAIQKDADLKALGWQLQAFVDIADGKRAAGPVAEYPVEERFRWISAVKSSVIQTSRPHPGVCENLDDTFSRLFEELVL